MTKRIRGKLYWRVTQNPFRKKNFDRKIREEGIVRKSIRAKRKTFNKVNLV